MIARKKQLHFCLKFITYNFEGEMKYFTRKKIKTIAFLSEPLRLNSQKYKPKSGDLNKFFLMFLLADANILLCKIVKCKFLSCL